MKTRKLTPEENNRKELTPEEWRKAYRYIDSMMPCRLTWYPFYIDKELCNFIEEFSKLRSKIFKHISKKIMEDESR